VVVTDAQGAPAGIVTDRDLRTRVVAAGRDAATTRAAEIMSSPPVTIRPGAFAFEALLEMTRRGIHHLVVVDEGRLVGVISTNDFIPLHATHPVALSREIERAPAIGALAALAERVTALVRQLLRQGGSAYDIGQLVAELNDRLVLRVLGLVDERLSSETPAPVPYCWLAFGSEARREQTLRTDQDNGLVYADPDPGAAAAAAAWYGRFSGEVVRGLVETGFPPCEGGIMASNPRWCQPLAAWRAYFDGWMAVQAPEQILAASIFFDLRPLAGALELAASLRGLVREEAPGQRPFLRFLAHDVVSRPVPLTMFGNVATGRGERRGRVDVKAGGGMQLVGAGRLHALELGLEETNTVDRFRAAAERGLYKEEVAAEIADAWQHLVRLRLVHQLGQLERGERPDNEVDVRRLSRADAVLLREALRTVARLQAELRERFATSLIGT